MVAVCGESCIKTNAQSYIAFMYQQDPQFWTEPVGVNNSGSPTSSFSKAYKRIGSDSIALKSRHSAFQASIEATRWLSAEHCVVHLDNLVNNSATDSESRCCRSGFVADLKRAEYRLSDTRTSELRTIEKLDHKSFRF